jgi:CheY-like chemotaxis protein
MPSVLISEPHVEVRELLARVVEAMGYEAVVDEPSSSEAIDILLIEPGSEQALARAQRLRAARPELPIVCVSIYPPQLESDLLYPSAYLIKPFSVAELQGVLRNALAAASGAAGIASAPPSHQTQ